jgi:hypothetical protein
MRRCCLHGRVFWRIRAGSIAGPRPIRARRLRPPSAGGVPSIGSPTSASCQTELSAQRAPPVDTTAPQAHGGARSPPSPTPIPLESTGCAAGRRHPSRNSDPRRGLSPFGPSCSAYSPSPRAPRPPRAPAQGRVERRQPGIRGADIRGVADFTSDGRAGILRHDSTRAGEWVWTMNGAIRLSQSGIAGVPYVGYTVVK